jgi:hypothetical protein
MAGLQKTAIRSMLAFAVFSALMVLIHELHYTSLVEFEHRSSKIFNHVSHYIADHEPEMLRELEKAVFFHDDDDRGMVSHGDDPTGEEEETMVEEGQVVDKSGSMFDDDSVNETNQDGTAHSGGNRVTGDEKYRIEKSPGEFDDDSISETHVRGRHHESVAHSVDTTRAGVDDGNVGVTGTGASLIDRISRLWGTGTDSRHGTMKSALEEEGGEDRDQNHAEGGRSDDSMQDDDVEKTQVVKDADGTVVKIKTPDGKEHAGSDKHSAIGDSSTDHDYGKVSSLHAAESPSSTSSFTAATAGGGSRKGQRGELVCGGKKVDSEIIYWREVQGDAEFESPITKHHGEHDDRYITYEYDQGGWNNVRMSMECMIVLAHSTGRTLVVPPQQHLYLLGATHKDKEDAKAHDEMGFADFFDVGRLRAHKGFHMMSMEEFLAKEGVAGGLGGGMLPPLNSTKVWGGKLWKYLDKVADAQPEWMGRYVVFPAPPDGYGKPGESEEAKSKRREAREAAFGGGRSPVRYDETLQKAHHIHFPADHHHRVLQHFYAWGFFPDPAMQSFYKRFVRDYMRYRDPIQCAGAQLLNYVRNEAYKLNPASNGEFYAIHARRGDFQFKEVKIGASEMVSNLRFENGTSIIPRGAMVYLSTDDPDGVCKNCVAQRKPCSTFEKGKLPPGCPEDPSWTALKEEGGWEVRMLRDFTKKGALKGVNPNWFGMVESIVCSRAKAFAGTYFSTFTGYIHRLRGYHGLGEATYYHHKRFLFHPQMTKSVGHGFSREWRSGWVDDDHGEII